MIVWTEEFGDDILDGGAGDDYLSEAKVRIPTCLANGRGRCVSINFDRHLVRRSDPELLDILHAVRYSI